LPGIIINEAPCLKKRGAFLLELRR